MMSHFKASRRLFICTCSLSYWPSAVSTNPCLSMAPSLWLRAFLFQCLDGVLVNRRRDFLQTFDAQEFQEARHVGLDFIGERTQVGDLWLGDEFFLVSLCGRFGCFVRLRSAAAGPFGEALTGALIQWRIEVECRLVL